MQLGVKPMGTPRLKHTSHIATYSCSAKHLVTHKERWCQAVTTQGTCEWWVERALYLATKVECKSEDQTSRDSNAVKCTQIDTCTQLLATTSSGNTCDPQELQLQLWKTIHMLQNSKQPHSLIQSSGLYHVMWMRMQRIESALFTNYCRWNIHPMNEFYVD